METQKCSKCQQAIGSNVYSCPNCGTINAAANIDVDATPRVTQNVTQQTASLPPAPTQTTVIPEVFSPASQEQLPPTPIVPAQLIKETCVFGTVFFSNKARIGLPLTPVQNIAAPYPTISPRGRTGLFHGIKMAGQMLIQSGAKRKGMLVVTDGIANVGPGNPKTSAVEEATDLLESHQIKIGALGITGGTSNFDHDTLAGIAYSPSLVGSVGSDEITKKVVKYTQSIIQGTHGGDDVAFVLVLDESSSMADGGKQQETNTAIVEVIQFLQREY